MAHVKIQTFSHMVKHVGLKVFTCAFTLCFYGE